MHLENNNSYDCLFLATARAGGRFAFITYFIKFLYNYFKLCR